MNISYPTKQHTLEVNVCFHEILQTSVRRPQVKIVQSMTAVLRKIHVNWEGVPIWGKTHLQDLHVPVLNLYPSYFFLTPRRRIL